MTGASLFNWDHDRHTLQGGIDSFGDAFGKEGKNDENNTGNSETTSNPEPPSNPETSNCFKEVQSTYTFPNNWRTVLRINTRNPMFVTQDYVDAMFSGVFTQWPKKLPRETEAQQTQNQHEQKKPGCILM